MEEFRYLCIDLKSFFASVECVDRGLDPMTTPLVVADPGRGQGTICLAVSPALKARGVKNRCRLYQIPPELSYVQVAPRMQVYMEYSARVYGVFLQFVSPEDVHVYSVDEAFLDLGPYRKLYGTDGVATGRRILRAVEEQTGLVAACGVGTNLYLAKVALDITAKKSPEGIGVLDEAAYCRTLGEHRPLTDFWQIGAATQARLAGLGIYTMNDLAAYDPDVLYDVFGINAELLIDHARGIEPVEMRHIKGYRSQSHSLCLGQVLMRDYTKAEGVTVVKEMMDQLCLQMAEAGQVCGSVSLQVDYSYTLREPPARGTVAAPQPTCACGEWLELVEKLYGRLVRPELALRRFTLSCQRLQTDPGRQLSLWEGELSRSRQKQEAMVGIRRRFGGNAIFRGMDLLQEGTARERNQQIGGHKACGEGVVLHVGGKGGRAG